MADAPTPQGPPDGAGGAEFLDQDLTGAQFEGSRLVGARFHNLALRDAVFHWVDLRGASIDGALIDGMTISADFERLVVNGVDVAPLIEAELDRRHPGRAAMRPTDADGFREGWALLRGLWNETIERARTLPPDLLHESVDGEWSFIETLRHLTFAVEAWVLRVVLGDPAPWHPWSLPFDEMDHIPGIPRDRNVRPSLDEVLAVLDSRHAVVEAFLDGLTDDVLAGTTEPVLEPGYPEPQAFPVAECLRVVLIEEFEHRLFAERDLDALTAR